MKLSKLIKKLQEIHDTMGNVPVLDPAGYPVEYVYAADVGVDPKRTKKQKELGLTSLHSAVVIEHKNKVHPFYTPETLQELFGR